eukprot:scaffold49616_cov17-Prasinocladus_malaysianus.AAC.1
MNLGTYRLELAGVPMWRMAGQAYHWWPRGCCCRLLVNRGKGFCPGNMSAVFHLPSKQHLAVALFV